MKKVIIERDTYTSNQTTGTIKVVNEENVIVFSAMTLELADKNNQKQISCIPKGVYNCDRITSPKFGVCYRVNDVTNRLHILIHVGNYYTDIRGCILIGQGLVKLDKNNDLDLVNSQMTMNNFQLIAGAKIQLIIK
jgi:hypothetical protein